MAEIQVSRKDPQRFEVRVRDQTTTSHTVELLPEYYQKLTGGRVSEEVLIEKSFEFLLEREPNTMILRRFDLPTIARYFPEYEKIIAQQF